MGKKGPKSRSISAESPGTRIAQKNELSVSPRGSTYLVHHEGVDELLVSDQEDLPAEIRRAFADVDNTSKSSSKPASQHDSATNLSLSNNPFATGFHNEEDSDHVKLRNGDRLQGVGPSSIFRCQSVVLTCSQD